MFKRKMCLLLLVLGLVFLGISCGDDENNGNGPNGNNNLAGSMTATVSGALALNFSATTATGATDATNTMIDINGTMVAGNITYILNIAVYDTPKTGSFTVVDFSQDPTGKAQVLFSDNQGTASSVYSGISGTITITAINGRIKGTFNFTAQNGSGGSITVANGTFDVVNLEI